MSSRHFVFLLCSGLLCAAIASPALAAAEEKACTGHAEAASAGKPIRMLFGGDVVLGNSFLVDDIPASWDERYFAGVRPLLKKADLVFGNLEGVLTESKDSMKQTEGGRAFAFSFPPRYAELLRKEGFNIVNVANNHAYDFREEGYHDTLHNLEQAGILAAGPRGRIAVLTILGFKIAMIGFTYTSKFNSVFELDQDAALVRQAKAEADYVIVTFHAGAEGPAAIWHGDADEMFMGEDRGNEVAFAHAMIDAGADLAVGHGPHVLREAECYRGHPIVYSLGNFVGVGGLSIKKVAGISALLEVELNPDGSLRHIDLASTRFDGSKVPQLDSREYGTRLVNYLGQHALYPGSFIEFPVKPEGQERFENWLRDNMEPPVPANPPPADNALHPNTPSDQDETLHHKQ
jgi:Bacterial capsule synthesis protein PGA_cap